MSPNHLFQYSVVSALMDGVAETGLTISDLVIHGNHGLGTFRHMVGEMIIVDGTAYQMNLDGSVLALDDAACAQKLAPFAMITDFRPSITARVPIQSKSNFGDILSEFLPGTKNHYLAFKVEGLFKTVTVRTVGGQQYPHESLAELGKHQVSHTFEEIKGTVIGFRSPTFMQGVSVAGDHLHFIAASKDSGGHVLACESHGEVEITAAPISAVHLQLPSNDEDFNHADLISDPTGIAKVEG